jgi:hypothetical protein
MKNIPDEIDNNQNIIDSRDIIARIEYLENLKEDAESEDNTLEDYEQEELTKLKELAEQGENNASDWAYGSVLVKDSYFTEFAEDEADQLGLMNESSNSWPFNHIDWIAAAEELQQDYSDIDFDGITYWVR